MSYNSKFGTDSDSIRKISQYNGLWTKKDTGDWITRFTRFGLIDPYSYVQNTREYIFFTRPDLHLLDGSDVSSELKNEPYFVEQFRLRPDTVRLLQRSSASMRSPFIPVLTVAAKSNVDLPSINADTIESSANVYGTVINYAGSSEASDEGHDFSVEFEDTKDLDIYHLFRLWDKYERYKRLGLVTPPKLSYILKKELHDQVALFKIIVAEDGETIIHYSKMYGVLPKGIPRDAFSSMDKDGDLMLSMSFHANFVLDMEPMIIDDFNALVAPYMKGEVAEIYDPELEIVDRGWVDCPFITRKDGHYKLKWRRY